MEMLIMKTTVSGKKLPFGLIKLHRIDEKKSVNLKINQKTVPKFKYTQTYSEEKKKTMAGHGLQNSIRGSIIFVIKILEREAKENDTKKLSEKMMAENFSKSVKDNKYKSRKFRQPMPDKYKGHKLS